MQVIKVYEAICSPVTCILINQYSTEYINMFSLHEQSVCSLVLYKNGHAKINVT